MFKEFIRIESFTLSSIPVGLDDLTIRKDAYLYRINILTGNKQFVLSLHLSKIELSRLERYKYNKIQYFVLGDYQDIDRDKPGYMGNGLLIQYNSEQNSLEIHTSITGLPAAFIYQKDNKYIVSSDIYNIATILNKSLQFDPDSILNIALIGHPVNHRTLFKNISIIPAGKHLALSSIYNLEVLNTWGPPAEDPFKDWSEYIDARRNSLKAAVQRLDKNNSFFSLTAGLDSRAIFSLLSQENHRLPVYTMSGKSESLDAKRARQLCKHYEFPYKSISIDSDFTKNLPNYAQEASRLSGGLESLRLALEVYYYISLPDELGGRITGNLGNQVGRSGNEGTSMRNASLDLLTNDIKSSITNKSEKHWFKEIFPENNVLNAQYLIQNEYLYAAVANYSIGSHYVVQQTPYADATLISQKLREPELIRPKSDSIWKIKLNDLRHRFLGDSIKNSFQRQLIKDIGGYAATCPINWGWRAKGGVSIEGVFFGSMALVDTVVSTQMVRHPFTNKIVDLMGIRGISGFEEVNILESFRIREYVSDMLLSTISLQNGILNPYKIKNLVDSDMADPRNRNDIEFVMDIILAQLNYL